jgi:hypothetical protein
LKAVQRTDLKQAVGQYAGGRCWDFVLADQEICDDCGVSEQFGILMDRYPFYFGLNLE